jgi:hypothetical protein
VTAADPGLRLRDGAHDAHWDGADLWLAAVALGGDIDLGDVLGILAGRQAPTRPQYVVLSAALNDHFADLGRDHPVRTWDGSPQPTGRPPPI